MTNSIGPGYRARLNHLPNKLERVSHGENLKKERSVSIKFERPRYYVPPATCHYTFFAVTNAYDPLDTPTIQTSCTYFSAAAAEHGCCAAAAASRRRELRLMTDVAESCAPFPLQLHHAHLQLHLLPLPLSLTDTDSTTVLDAHVFSPLHEFGASCPLPEGYKGRETNVSRNIETRDTCKISRGKS